MKSNFHLETSKRNHDYHIHLHGVFDGASAFELLNVILNEEKEGQTIFIDTSHLKKAFPFGRAILESNLPRNGIRAKLHFKGTRAGDILPTGCKLLTKQDNTDHICQGNCKNCQCKKNSTPSPKKM